MKLNAYERLLASSDVIAPPTSFGQENANDLGERQGVAFHQRQDDSIDPPKVKSAYTPEFKPDGDSADVMYATAEEDEAEIDSEGAQSELEQPSKLTATLSTLSFLVNADSTAQTENPFPVVHDYPPEEHGASTHDNGMMLESAPSPVDMMQVARSTHGMDALPLVENQADNPDLVSATKEDGPLMHAAKEVGHGIDELGEGMAETVARLLASVDPGSTANDNLNPYPDKFYPTTDGYLAAEAEEVEADINPAMFGNGTQPLGGMGG
jgi:hypothetical protein